MLKKGMEMEMEMDNRLKDIVRRFKDSGGNITVLTGAGISAESGIPTFRGRDGYWTIGSTEYHPQEMATFHMFTRRPFDVWEWYLYRKTVCAQADPNSGHGALVELESLFLDRFCLITQNVDGLHLRAGNTLERTYQIHGNINFMRCSEECHGEIFPVPPEIPSKDKSSGISEEEKELLTCPRCGAMSRPHVLWFDESYDERFFRFESSLRRAEETDLLLVIGTSGATNLPMQVGALVARKGAALIDVNPETNPFSEMARSTPNGYYHQGASGEILPQIVELLRS